MIVKFIQNIPSIMIQFNHHSTDDGESAKSTCSNSTVYSLTEYLNAILLMVINGISYRNLKNYTNIHWNLVYKFYNKLIKHNGIGESAFSTFSKLY